MLGVVALATIFTVLVGCGAKKDTSASQTAARVGKDEVTVHQINFVLQQQRGLRPEEVDAASKLILERLIDQQLLLRKADGLKLDRDLRVMEQIEAGKADILARAATEKLGEAATKPTPEDIKRYFDANPALFSDRRVYDLQEINIEVEAEQVSELRDKLASTKNIHEFIEYLKTTNLRFAGNQVTRAAEQLPQARLDEISKMKDGQATIYLGPKSVQVLVMVSTRSQPVTEEQARPAIEQFLLGERRRKLVEDDLKALRGSAKIEYLGKFAEAAVTIRSAPSAVSTKASASSTLSGGDISKGMGLK
jgi:EpsD family peptidyl-prolyl cis-trans isomerase